MAPRRIASFALNALLVLIAGFVVFDLVSAFAIAHHAPFYVALALGLAVFPVLPAVWHVLGERKRRHKRGKMKTPPKASTTGLVRLLLRAGVVGVAAVAALVGLTNGSWEAVRHHALWFVPHSEPRLSTDSPLVALVPAHAEGILWLRPTQVTSDALTALGTEASLLETVYAIGPREGSRTAMDAALITRFPGDTLPHPAWLTAIGVPAAPSLSVGPFATGLGPSWRTTPGWAGAIGSGPPQDVLALAARVPNDAVAVALVKPKIAKDADDVIDAVAYVTSRDGKLELTADATLVSPAAAEKFRADFDSLLGMAQAVAFTTVNCLKSHGATFELTRDGVHVRAHASLELDAARACASSR